MTCNDVSMRFKEFLEDQLVEEEYQAILEHLGECPRCKEVVGRVGSLSNLLRELGQVKAPSDFGFTVLSRVKKFKKANSIS